MLALWAIYWAFYTVGRTIGRAWGLTVCAVIYGAKHGNDDCNSPDPFACWWRDLAKKGGK